MMPTLGPTAKRKNCLAMEDAGSTSLRPGKNTGFGKKMVLVFSHG